jgi:hypothetical protein
MSSAEGRAADQVELSFGGALRAAASAMTDDFVRFVIGNVVWLAMVGTAIVVGRVYPPGRVLVVVAFVGASHGLCRMAATTVRGRRARLLQFRQGVSRRRWAGLGLGCAQLALIALAATNVTIGSAQPSLLRAMSAAVSAYAGLFLVTSVLVVWPLLLDPDRDQLGIGVIVRHGLGVIASRPGRLVVLVIVEAVLVTVGLQTFVAAIVLPAFGLSIACWVVLPLADELVGRSDPSTGG